MSGDDSPLLKRKPRKPTEFWKIPLDVVPYIKLGSPSGAPGFGIETGLKGTF